MFVGPSATGQQLEAARVAGFQLRPPAQRGDLEFLVDEEPGLVALVDGRFQQCLSVGHAELRAALASGWSIWGLGSLGAIRAYEMRTFGMRGFGQVFGHFVCDQDFQDDEVALLHMPDPPYSPASEPLVHTRYFVAELEDLGTLSHRAAQEVIDELKALWFGSRTLVATVSTVGRFGGARAERLAEGLLASFDRFRIKSRDLSTFLDLRVWKQENYQPSWTPAPYSRTPLRPSADASVGIDRPPRAPTGAGE